MIYHHAKIIALACAVTEILSVIHPKAGGHLDVDNRNSPRYTLETRGLMINKGKQMTAPQSRVGLSQGSRVGPQICNINDENRDLSRECIF